jgi:DNA-binding Lrp family transcriptional regulator
LTNESIDVKVKDALTTWKKLDTLDVKILEGLSMLGPRNLALIAENLQIPQTTVRYRVQRMLSNSILFLHLNPYHTFMGLKKSVVFFEAEPGYEDLLLDCLRVNDFWLYLGRIYGPYEGCAGIWTVPKEKANLFEEFTKTLIEYGVARSVELNWSTCFEGIPVQKRWFDQKKLEWEFNWGELVNEIRTIEGSLPYTLVEPDDWPIRVDLEDLLIIKELEKDGKTTLTEISEAVNLSLETVKYHFREHVVKKGLIEGYQVEIYRFPFPLSELLWFKFEFNSYDQFRRFALALHDKPFPIFLGKVLGENALISQIYLPKWEFRKFVNTLSSLIREGHLMGYHYFIQDMYQNWRQTIPYQHFYEGVWDYDEVKHLRKIERLLKNVKSSW